MVRKLLLLFVGLISWTSASAQVFDVHFSPAEKAAIAMTLKLYAQDLPDQSTMALLKHAEQIHSQIQDLPAITVEVASYKEFLEHQKAADAFAQYSLEEISESTLKTMAVKRIYVSKSARVQKQIQSYYDSRQKIIRTATFTGSLVSFFYMAFKGINSVEKLEDSIGKDFQLIFERFTGRLNPNNSTEVAILAKFMNLYYRELPRAQKAEINYRLMQLPILSSPGDILLTMIQYSGPQLQKLLQIKARSNDMPAMVTKLFEKLESQGVAVPWWKTNHLLQAEEIDMSTFSYFEKKALGVGTMAQTHRAQYVDHSGIRYSIAARYLKPGIEKLLEMDHDILMRIARIIDNDPEYKDLELPSMAKLVENVHRSVEEELSIQRTIVNQTRARQVYNSSVFISFNSQKTELAFNVPTAYAIGKNKNIMVQPLIIGNKPTKTFAEYSEIYPDLYKVVSDNVAELWIDQAFFKTGFFHADLHQGNMMALVEDGKVTVNLLDFGMTGQLTQQLRESALLLSVGNDLKNAALIAKHFLKLTEGKSMSYEKFLPKVQAQIKKFESGDPAEATLENWTIWAMRQGLEFQYEFLKLNRGIEAIKELLKNSGSAKTINSIAQTVAIKNAAYVAELLYKEPLIKKGDYAKILKSAMPLKDNKSSAHFQCRNLF